MAGDSDSGPTGALVFGCICASSMIILSIILLIWELLRPEPVSPAPPLTPPPPPSLQQPLSTQCLLRNERFHSSIPGCHENDFTKSHYLKYYRATESCPSTDSVVNCLRGLKGINDLSHPVLHAIQIEHEDYNAIKVYTSNYMFGNRAFYSYVNSELLRDNKITLKYLMPFIRRATSQINNKGPFSDRVVYRGTNLSKDQRDFFTKGKVFRFPGFTSTSTNQYTAQGFGNILFQIHIPANCRQVRNVANISYFSFEHEWLFSPYSRFKVIENNYQRITLQSLDNIGPT